jgi:hypothetical protein
MTAPPRVTPGEVVITIVAAPVKIWVLASD